MTHRIFATILVVSVCLFASPTLAQSTEAGQESSLSKPVFAALSEVQKLQAEGDTDKALARIVEIEAFPSLSLDDIYFIAAVKLNLAMATRNSGLIEDALGKMLSTGKVSAVDQPIFIRTLSSLALQRQDFKAATKIFEQLLTLSPNDSQVMISLVDLYLREKHNSKALAMTNRAIGASEAAGAVALEAWYRRALSIAYDSRTLDAIQPAALALVAAYPNPVNWRDSFRALRVSYPESAEPAELDLWRLRSATGSLSTERDFVDFAQTALRLGFPNDAASAVNLGIAKGILNPSRPLISETIATASNKANAQKASLPHLEGEAISNRKLALNIGDIYFGDGEFSKAASFYRMAIGEGGVDRSVANLRLGAALARAGDKAGAKAAFTRVNGGFSETLARYWIVFVTR